MEVVKPCVVCCTNRARHTCMLCGRLVCPNCYEPLDGICKMCARIPKERRLRGDPDVRLMR